MKTLVYFASGPEKEEYLELNYDRIFLIDNCFRNSREYEKSIFTKGKVTCVGLDCLGSIAHLRTLGVRVDCFVSLNEGLHEGGGRYAINSDVFLGYVMPLFNDNYIHIMNKEYYGGAYHVTMDLPFEMQEIQNNSLDYIDPFVFSRQDYHKRSAKVFRMKKKADSVKIVLNPQVEVNIIHDSIWNHYASLGAIVLSFADQGFGDFFHRIPKVLDINNLGFEDVLLFCVKNEIDKVGFTPWGKGNYGSFIELISIYREKYPKEILLFHLNQNDYKELKTRI